MKFQMNTQSQSQ